MVYDYLMSNVNYSSEAKEAGIEGRISVQVLTSTTGEISSVKILSDETEGKGGIASSCQDALNTLKNSNIKLIPEDSIRNHVSDTVEFVLFFCLDSSITEFFPLFPGCYETKETYAARKRCSDNEMRRYLLGKAGYPKEARENGIQGKVYIRFVVMPDGSIDKVEVARDMTAGGGLAEAAVEATQSMNQMEKRWTPGYQKGRPVPVRIMMPFIFKLASDEPETKKKKRRAR